MAPSKQPKQPAKQTKQPAPAAQEPEAKQPQSRFDKLIAAETKRKGADLTAAERDVVRAHADYLDKREAAGMGRHAARSAVSDEIMRQVETLTVEKGKELIDAILELVPGYRVSTLTMQVRNNEPKLRTVRINKPRAAKAEAS